MQGLFKKNFFSQKRPRLLPPKQADKKRVLCVLRRHYPGLRILRISEVSVFGRRKGINSQNWKIGCPHGSFILKCVGPDKAKSLQAKIRWTRKLSAAGFRLPRFYPNAAQDIISRHGGYVYCLSRFVEGEYFGSSWRRWTELMRLQRGLITYVLKHSPKNPSKNFESRMFFDAQMTMAMLAHDTLSKDDREYVVGKYRELKRVYAERAGHWKRAIFHTDMHPLNLLFRGDKVSRLVDFDSFALAILDISLGFSVFKCSRELLVGMSARAFKKRLILLRNIFHNHFPKHDYRALLLYAQIDVLKRTFGALNHPQWRFMLSTQLAGLREIDRMRQVLAEP